MPTLDLWMDPCERAIREDHARRIANTPSGTAKQDLESIGWLLSEVDRLKSLIRTHDLPSEATVSRAIERLTAWTEPKSVPAPNSDVAEEVRVLLRHLRPVLSSPA